MADKGPELPPFDSIAADRIQDAVDRLVKTSPGKDVLRKAALVHLAKPYDVIATLLVSNVFEVALSAGPAEPTPSQGLQAVTLDLALALSELKRIHDLPRLSEDFKRHVGGAHSALLDIVSLLDEVSRRGLGRRVQKPKAAEKG